LQGLSVNVLSDVVIAGTERLPNGNTDTVMVRYDTFGNQTQWLRCPIPAGYKSATLLAPILLGSDVTWLTGQIFPANGDGVVNISSAYATLCNSDGTVQRQLLFDSAPGTSNLVRDVCVHPNIVMTGQTGASSGPRSLMVVHF
jgi:hypothetical protein